MVQATEQIQSPSTQRCDRTSGDQPAPSEALRTVRQKMVQLGGAFSNSSALPLLLSELEDWEAVLKAEPEVIHKLYSFEATVEDKPKPDKQRRVAQSPPRLRLRGPSR